METSDTSERWVIVLAGGDGVRLRSMTTSASGVTIPKQYCSFGSEQTLLDRALARARAIAPPSRVVTLVARQHRRHWQAARTGAASEHLIVQPRNRGTAPGLLLALLHVARRAPNATVAVLPSDHFVRDEAALQRALDRALDDAARRRSKVVLLGVQPSSACDDYGYLVPADGVADDLPGVARFVEKPRVEEARALIDQGALWSSFVFAGRVDAFLELFADAQPRLLQAFLEVVGAGVHGAAVDELYERLTASDLSRDVLEAAISRLCAARVPECGWSDLGTPERLRAALPMLRRDREGPPARRIAGDAELLG
ncbi:MAG: hypothetical protein KC636_33390 [Myxococcales bacterium]|nr:hypothetical protein [Myxococcales bacterium]